MLSEVHPDISIARTLDTTFYNSPGAFETAKDKIFLNSWHFIGDISSLKKPGECRPVVILPDYMDEPVVITNDKSGDLHCLSNVCTHRGNLLVYDACQSANLRCKYHGRLFQLDGKMISMPEFKEVKDFPSADDHLRQYPLEQWGNLLFTTLGNENWSKFFNEMKSRMNWLPLEEFIFYPALSKEYSVHANWALYCENYLEGFHIPFVHADLNAVIDYGNYTTELFRYSNLQTGYAKDDEHTFKIPAGHPDHGKNVAAYYFWVFPNMMFNFYPWGLSINIVEPKSVSETIVKFYSYVWKEELRNVGAGAELDKVEMEDEEIVENVQRGVRSRAYRHGRYSVTREQGTHHFHRLICEFMNKNGRTQ